MYVVDVKNVTLQFDSPINSKEAVLEIVDLVNAILLRDQVNVNAQVIVDYENLEFEAEEDIEEGEEENE